MAMTLPQFELRQVQAELMEYEPLQMARSTKTPRAQEHIPALKNLPNINFSPRFVRSHNWAPPTLRPKCEVAVYYVTDNGLRSEGVELARVVTYIAEERQVLVRLKRTGDSKVVPMSWVLDRSMAGTSRHPWHSGTTTAPAAPVAPVADPEAEAPTPPSTAPGGQGLSLGVAGRPEVASGAEALREALLLKYGSTIDAWGAIDALGRGEAALQAFVLACRHFHYLGDLASVFAAIDRERTGSITLRTFRGWMDGAQVGQARQAAGASQRSPAAGSREAIGVLLEESGDGRAAERARAKEGARLFKLAMTTQFDSLALAWDAFDTNQDGVMQFLEFCAATRKLSFKGNLRLIWDELVGEPAPAPTDFREDDRVLRPERLDAQLAERLQTLRAQGLSCAAGLQSGGSRRRMVETTPPIWPEGASARTQEDRAAPKSESSRPSSGMVPQDAKAFRDGMINKFGSLVLAWEVLDHRGKGHLDFKEFILACRSVEFGGKFKQVFDDLTGGRGTLVPSDLDPGLPYAMERQRRLSSAGDDGSAGGITGSSSSRRRRSAANLTARGSIASLASDGLGNEWTGRNGRLASAVSMAEVSEVAMARDASAGPPDDAQAFLAAMRKKFGGSLAVAWTSLDERGRGELNYREFVQACRRLDFVGNIRQVFEELSGGHEAVVPSGLGDSLPAALAKMQGQPGRRG
mmetsp:Transcript_40541/g.130364  ORF Transcript_40541/g.130364 Transcript_40541/m.130364 type:complete len:692 (-) Transcript_40541:144-2219(-)